jgi:hypothetical protein
LDVDFFVRKICVNWFNYPSILQLEQFCEKILRKHLFAQS